MSLRGVLFDAAGTLIELRESVGDTYARFAQRHGLLLPGWRLDDAFARVVDRADPMVFPDADPREVPQLERAWWAAIVRSTFLAADSTVRFPDPEAFFDELFTHYSGTAAWRPVADARSALASLAAAGLRLGVASNFDHRLPDLLQSLDFNVDFESITLPGSCRTRKPDPAFYGAAAASLSLPPAEVLYVGDGQDDDVSGARAAGLAAVAIDDVPGFAVLPDFVARPLT